jgi:hypothetical protein
MNRYLRLATVLTTTLSLASASFAQQPRDVEIKNVPFVSQLSAKCSPNYLCQYACASMVAGKAWGGNWATTSTMQTLAKHAKGSTCPSKLSNSHEARDALNALGNTKRARVDYGNFDGLKAQIANGRPASVSIKYSELGNDRFDRNWSAGHQVVVIGFSETKQTWTYLDPLAKSGGKKTVSSATFRNAVSKLAGQSSGFYYLTCE